MSSITEVTTICVELVTFVTNLNEQLHQTRQLLASTRDELGRLKAQARSTDAKLHRFVTSSLENIKNIENGAKVRSHVLGGGG